jgi:hypothetical protein
VVAGKELVSAAEVPLLFGPWIVDKSKGVSLRHVFISYRQGKDSELVSLIFDTFTKFTFGPNHEAVDVFADTVRLNLGRDFRAEFVGSLTYSEIVMLLISSDSLARMQVICFYPLAVDNLLVEWIWSLHCIATKQGRVREIAPLILGTLDNSTNCRQSFDKGTLSEEVPTATIAVIESNLQALGLEPLSASGLDRVTVKEVVEKLLLFNFIYSPVLSEQEIAQSACEKLVAMLNLSAVGKQVEVSVPPTTSAAKPLDQLSVQEVTTMLTALDMSDACIRTFAEDKVNGGALAMIESLDELMTDCVKGTLIRSKAKFLWSKIEHYRVNGYH